MTWSQFQSARVEDLPDRVLIENESIPAVIYPRRCEDEGPNVVWARSEDNYWYGMKFLQLHRFTGPASDCKNNPGYWLFGAFYESEQHHSEAVAKMAKVKAFIRTRKLRRFIKLCRSKAFNEYWYAEGRPGRRWDERAILHHADSSDHPRDRGCGAASGQEIGPMGDEQILSVQGL